MIVWRDGNGAYVAVSQTDTYREIAFLRGGAYVMATVSIDPKDWPAVRDAVDNALADKAEK